jgi:hypothetical protein
MRKGIEADRPQYLKRANVPKIPVDAEHYDDARYTVYDAELDGYPCRWRCPKGTRRAIGFIRYAYDPRVEPNRKDHPWKDTWFSRNHP